MYTIYKQNSLVFNRICTDLRYKQVFIQQNSGISCILLPSVVQTVAQMIRNPYEVSRLYFIIKLNAAKSR